MKSARTLTGWHAAAIFGSFFGVIITVNLALAYSAVHTFPGLEVKNSYVASQEFDRRRTQRRRRLTSSHGCRVRCLGRKLGRTSGDS